jgi:hypothetical protein
MVSEIQLDDAEIEAHLFNRTSNRDNSSRMTGKSFDLLVLIKIFFYKYLL